MLKYLLQKEFKQIRHSKFMPKLILIFPCMLLLFMPWAATMEVTNIKIDVVDADRSVESRRLIDRIAASEYFILKDVNCSPSKAMQDVGYGKADIILEIPDGYGERIVLGERPQLQISANAVDGMKGSLGASYLTSIISGYDSGMSVIYKYNPYLDYKKYMIPALMAMIVVLICGFMPCLNIVSEKEVGTIEQMNVSPVSRVVFTVSKLLPYWIIGVIVITIGVVIAKLVYDMFPVGNLLNIYIASIIFIMVMSGMGLVISNYSATMQQSMFVMFFFILVLVLMSGLFTPVSSMPKWAQLLTYLNPFRYYMEMMRMVYLKGTELVFMWKHILVLIGFAICFYTWAVLSYRKVE